MRIGFALAPGYALMSLASAVEPLRAANQLAGRELYPLSFHAADAAFVASSSGGGFNCTPLRDTHADLVFMVAGGDPLAHDDPPLIHNIKALDRRQVRLGGISGGAAILARAGLMAGRRFTLHWLHIDELSERMPDLLIERALYVIDRDRYTCAGGVAAFDMMCTLIASQHGAEFAREVSDWFIHTRLRTGGEPQQLDPARRFNLHHPALESTVRLMSSHLADPLSPEQLGTLSGSSIRQLQRLFVAQFGRSMTRFYRDMRLEKADELLRHSSLPLSEIALMTGFSTPQHFSKSFVERFGVPPGRRRRGQGGHSPNSGPGSQTT